MGGQTRRRGKQIESENRRSAFQFSRHSLSVRPLARFLLPFQARILQWLFVERGGNYGRKTEKRMDPACEINEERRRKGSRVRRINIYTYRKRERESKKSSKLRLDKAIIASKRHRGTEMYQRERNNKFFFIFFFFSPLPL